MLYKYYEGGYGQCDRSQSKEVTSERFPDVEQPSASQAILHWDEEEDEVILRYVQYESSNYKSLATDQDEEEEGDDKCQNNFFSFFVCQERYSS